MIRETCPVPRIANRKSQMFSLILPAHNEAAVIGRTLRALTDGAEAGELEVIVVANGLRLSR